MATTMKRYYESYIESYEKNIQRYSEMSYYFVYSFKDKQMRENVVDTGVGLY